MAALTPEKFKVIGYTEEDANRIDRPTISYWQDAWRRLRKNPIAMGSLVVLGILLVMVIIGPHIKGYDYVSMNIAEKNQGVSSKYWFGTDNLGRDLFSRVWVGARASLIIAIVATAIKLIIGTVYGALMAHFGGWVDAIISRFIDILLAFPGLLLAITIVAVLGPGSVNTVIAITIFTIPGLTRMVRSVVLSLKSSEYVEACKTMGESNLRIIFTHVIPNSMSQIIVNVTLSLGTAILTASSLSFLGFGVTPPEAEWGAMLSQMREVIRTYPTGVLVPGIAITLVVMSFSLVGDGLRDALDPKLKNN